MYYMLKLNHVALIVIAILPIVLIVTSLVLQLQGFLGYSLYKIAFIAPPLLYCLKYNVSLRRTIWRFEHWQNGILPSVILGVVSITVFWFLYALLAPKFINETVLVQNMKSQFSVSLTTIAFIAPFTILINSFIEESFYRGFIFGQLQSYNRYVAYGLSAFCFTVQHLLFTYHWVGIQLLIIGSIALGIFALVTAYLYRTYNTIVAPWVLHIFGDIAMIGVAVWLLVK